MAQGLIKLDPRTHACDSDDFDLGWARLGCRDSSRYRNTGYRSEIVDGVWVVFCEM